MGPQMDLHKALIAIGARVELRRLLAEVKKIAEAVPEVFHEVMAEFKLPKPRSLDFFDPGFSPKKRVVKKRPKVATAKKRGTKKRVDKRIAKKRTREQRHCKKCGSIEHDARTCKKDKPARDKDKSSPNKDKPASAIIIKPPITAPRPVANNAGTRRPLTDEEKAAISARMKKHWASKRSLATQPTVTAKGVGARRWTNAQRATISTSMKGYWAMKRAVIRRRAILNGYVEKV
jgi:hypothetical protein